MFPSLSKIGFPDLEIDLLRLIFVPWIQDSFINKFGIASEIKTDPIAPDLNFKVEIIVSTAFCVIFLLNRNLQFYDYKILLNYD